MQLYCQRATPPMTSVETGHMLLRLNTREHSKRGPVGTQLRRDRSGYVSTIYTCVVLAIDRGSESPVVTFL